MADTWQTLEERFRELAAKAPELFLNFHPPAVKCKQGVLTEWEKSERGWSTPSGQWKWYISGECGNLHVDELAQLIHRADRLLSETDADSQSSRFVGVALDHYGNAVVSHIRNADKIFSDRPPSCFHNAAEVCALTAGYLGTSHKRDEVEPAIDCSEYTEEERRSGQWRKIMSLTNGDIELSRSMWSTRTKGTKGERIRVIEVRNQHYKVHIGDLPDGAKSKRSRDQIIKDWGKGK